MPVDQYLNIITLVLVAAVGPIAWLCVRLCQTTVSPRDGACGRCGYTLAGLNGRTTCPECGDDPRVLASPIHPLLHGPAGPPLVFALGAGLTALSTCALALAVGLATIRPLVAGLVIASLVMPIPLSGVLQGRGVAERARVIAAAWLAALVFVACFVAMTRWDPTRDPEGLSGVAASSVSIAGLGALFATLQWRWSRSPHRHA